MDHHCANNPFCVLPQQLHPKEEMPLYPQSILKKPTEFPPTPFNLEEELLIAAAAVAHEENEDDNESLDVVLPNRDLHDFGDFDRPVAQPGKL